MKYLGKMENNDDMVNKGYVDNSIKMGGITTTPVGKLPEGTDITNWSAVQVLSSILMDDNPNILITSPSIRTYEKGTELTNVDITVRVVKMVSNITSIKIYKDNTLLTTITDDVAGGGEFTYQYIGTINDDCSIKAVVENEGGLSGEAIINLRFIYSTYTGISQGTPSSSDILASKSQLLPAKGATDYFTCNVERIFIAYPAEFGALTAITDIQNNLSLLSSFVQSTITLNNANYYLYVLDENTTVINFGIRFE